MVKQKVVKGRRSVWLWPAVGVICAVLLGGMWLMMREGAPSGDVDETEDTAAQRLATRKKKQSLAQEKTAMAKKEKGAWRRASALKPSNAEAAASNDVETDTARAKRLADEAKQKYEDWRIADSNRLAKSEAILAAQAPRKHFDNEVENTIEVVTKPGAQFLILPQVNLSQQEVLEYLKRPVEYSEDDDEEALAAKKRTEAFKKEALDYIAKGGTLNQFLRDKASAAADEREAVDTIRREKDRILLTEGPEAAKAYLDQINPELKKLNLPEIRMGRADVSKLRHQQRKLQQEKQK